MAEELILNIYKRMLRVEANVDNAEVLDFAHSRAGFFRDWSSFENILEQHVAWRASTGPVYFVAGIAAIPTYRNSIPSGYT